MSAGYGLGQIEKPHKICKHKKSPSTNRTVIDILGFKPAGQFSNVVNQRLPGKRSIGSMTLKKVNRFHKNLDKWMFPKR